MSGSCPSRNGAYETQLSLCPAVSGEAGSWTGAPSHHHTATTASVVSAKAASAEPIAGVERATAVALAVAERRAKPLAMRNMAAALCAGQTGRIGLWSGWP